MNKEISEILKENRIHIFYNILKKEFLLLDLDLCELTSFENLSHLSENLTFQLENVYREKIMFKDEEIIKLSIKVNGTTYKPTKDLIYYNKTQKLINTNYPKDFVNQLNYKIDDVESLKAKFPTILKIVENLSEGEKKSTQWLLDWFSYVVRYNLGLEKNKLNTSILFYGLQGSGKNLFVNGIIETLIKTKELSQNDLDSPYNFYLVKSNLITFNEVQVKKGKGTMDEIKNMITCKNHSVNIKNVPQFEIPNSHHYLFTSNKSVPLFIEGDDRRFTIFKPLKALKSFMNQSQIDSLDYSLTSLDSESEYFEELINFSNYLINNKNLISNVKAPFENETKKILTTKSTSLNNKFIHELKTKEFYDFCEEYGLDYKKYFLGYKDNKYYTQKKMLIKLYEDFYKIHTSKFEFQKRKDQILDELMENKIFINLGKETRRISLMGVHDSETYKYLYQYNSNHGLYLDEKKEEVPKVDLIEELEETIL